MVTSSFVSLILFSFVPEIYIVFFIIDISSLLAYALSKPSLSVRSCCGVGGGVGGIGGVGVGGGSGCPVFLFSFSYRSINILV